MNKGLLSITALLLAAVLFFAVNIAAGTGLRGARVDLTEGRLYTLSEGSRNIARKLPEPVDLTLYYSEKVSNDFPQFKSYAARVREVLREFAAASGGKVRVQVIDPEPFSDAEDRAVAAGLAGVPTGRGADRFYFGIVGRSTTDKTEIIPFLQPDREGFLEYDVARMIYLLSGPQRRALGLMSWLPIEGSPFNPMGQPSQPWQIVAQLREYFDVRTIEASAREIPDDVEVLMVVHPKNITAEAQYAIDQFVLRGGRLLLFVDPNCEQDVPPGMNNPLQAMSMPKGSELNALLGAWGARVAPDKIVGDLESAIPVGVGGQGRAEQVDYVAWINLTRGKGRFAEGDPVTSGLNSLIFATAGAVEAVEGATTTLQPLVQTSTESALIDVSKVSFIPQPKEMLGEFKSEGKSFTVAARITGKARSAFPDGPPSRPEDALAAEAAQAAHLAESREGVNVVVIADCDMLYDRFWIRQQNLGPISLGYVKFSDNGDLVIGALDNLAGSSDLISLRARGQTARPFKRVEEIQRKARAEYAREEQRLQQSIRETEQRIVELQQQRSDGGSVLLTPEQQREIDKLREQMVATRRQLREVQHQLRKDIEGLGVILKAVNIAFMPAAVALIALGLSAARLGRRRSDRLKAARA